MRGSLENVFLQCPDPTLQQVSSPVELLGLETMCSEYGFTTGAARAND